MDSTTEIITIDPSLLNTQPITIEPVLSIGTGRGGATDEFGLIAGIATDAKGRIFVADPLSWRVRVYDSRGTFIRDIGGKGNGPGELGSLHRGLQDRPVNAIALIGDTLFVINSSLVALDTTGKFRFTAKANIASANALGLTPVQGNITITRLKFGGGPYTFSEYDVGRGTEGPAVELTERHVDFQNQGLLSRKPTPLQDLGFAVAENGRVYFAVGDSFHVAVIAPGSVVERAYVAKVPRVRATKQDIIDVGYDVQRVIEERVTAPNLPDYARLVREGPKWDYRQAIGKIIVSDHGTLLLQRPDISEAPYSRFKQELKIVWAMIDAAGKPLANYHLPNDFLPKLFIGCKLYGIEENAVRTQIVVVYDLSQGVAQHRCF